MQRKTARSGGSKVRVVAPDQSSAPKGVAARSGQPEGVADGQPHVGLGQLGQRRPVAQLHHGVHDRLGVHDDVDPVVVDAEELVGLDHLEALVHEGRRVDGDLRSHRPGRVGQRVGHRDRAEPLGRPAAERAARGGEEQPGHVGRPAAARPGTGAARSAPSRPGRSRRPGVRRAFCTTGAPAMSDSLLASASRLPASSAAIVTGSPAKPTTRVEHDVGAAAPRRPCPRRPRAPRCRPARRRAPRRSEPGSPITTTAGRNSAAWATSCAAERWAARACTRNRSGSPRMTSSAWVPMEPVEPSRLTVRISSARGGAP